jgi:hypothetical protein
MQADQVVLVTFSAAFSGFTRAIDLRGSPVPITAAAPPTAEPHFIKLRRFMGENSVFSSQLFIGFSRYPVKPETATVYDVTVEVTMLSTEFYHFKRRTVIESARSRQFTREV